MDDENNKSESIRFPNFVDFITAYDDCAFFPSEIENEPIQIIRWAYSCKEIGITSVTFTRTTSELTKLLIWGKLNVKEQMSI